MDSLGISVWQFALHARPVPVSMEIWYMYVLVCSLRGATVQNRLLNYVMLSWPLFSGSWTRPAPPTVRAGPNACSAPLQRRRTARKVCVGGLPCLKIGKSGQNWSKSTKVALRTADKRLIRFAPAIKHDEAHHPHAFDHHGPSYHQRIAIFAPTGRL